MNIYKPSELKAFLDENNKKANKKLSQNFLIDKNILDKIVKLNHAYKSFPVLEVGPGPGALTEQLLASGFRVQAVDLDKEFIDLLKKRLTPFFPSLVAIHQDFLEFDLASLHNSSALWTVIANLPYHITSKVLIKLLIHSQSFAALTLMVQKEFYDRIRQLSGKDYGIINVLMRVCCNHVEGFTVSASCFYPAPRVDSAILHIGLSCDQSPARLSAFYEFLKVCFSSRRKKLISNLAHAYDLITLKIAFDSFGIDENARVEMINPETYFKLFKDLSSRPSINS